MIKSLAAREVFQRCPHVQPKRWSGEFWSDGYFASTVGKHGDEGMIAKYFFDSDTPSACDEVIHSVGFMI